MLLVRLFSDHISRPVIVRQLFSTIAIYAPKQYPSDIVFISISSKSNRNSLFAFGPNLSLHGMDGWQLLIFTIDFPFRNDAKVFITSNAHPNQKKLNNL